jgi:16S rRNA (uracil1498-N3)-methyltransferase
LDNPFIYGTSFNIGTPRRPFEEFFMPRSTSAVQKISQRLHVTQDLSAGKPLRLEDKQAHYLRNVVRLEAGASVLVFNGRDGEWRATIVELNKKHGLIEPLEQTRAQDTPSDIWLLVAPVKKDRLDYLAQKATEMGVGKLWPVITARTQGGQLKPDRLQANAIEAAEQCNIMSVPEIAAATRLPDVLAGWPQDRALIFCDEEADSGAGLAALDGLKGQKLALLIGPEGGFDAAERASLAGRVDTISLSLGPRILRTDTAVVAALALIQAQLGDWSGDSK